MAEVDDIPVWDPSKKTRKSLRGSSRHSPAFGIDRSQIEDHIRRILDPKTRQTWCVLQYGKDGKLRVVADNQDQVNPVQVIALPNDYPNWERQMTQTLLEQQKTGDDLENPEAGDLRKEQRLQADQIIESFSAYTGQQGLLQACRQYHRSGMNYCFLSLQFVVSEAELQKFGLPEQFRVLDPREGQSFAEQLTPSTAWRTKLNPSGSLTVRQFVLLRFPGEGMARLQRSKAFQHSKQVSEWLTDFLQKEILQGRGREEGRGEGKTDEGEEEEDDTLVFGATVRRAQDHWFEELRRQCLLPDLQTLHPDNENDGKKKKTEDASSSSGAAGENRIVGVDLLGAEDEDGGVVLDPFWKSTLREQMREKRKSREAARLAALRAEEAEEAAAAEQQSLLQEVPAWKKALQEQKRREREEAALQKAAEEDGEQPRMDASADSSGERESLSSSSPSPPPAAAAAAPSLEQEVQRMLRDFPFQARRSKLQLEDPESFVRAILRLNLDIDYSAAANDDDDNDDNVVDDDHVDDDAEAAEEGEKTDGPLTWILFDYSGKERLRVSHTSPSGGFSELKPLIAEDKVHFLIWRQLLPAGPRDQKAFRNKLSILTWTGKFVKVLMKARVPPHREDLWHWVRQLVLVTDEHDASHMDVLETLMEGVGRKRRSSSSDDGDGDGDDQGSSAAADGDDGDDGSRKSSSSPSDTVRREEKEEKDGKGLPQLAQAEVYRPPATTNAPAAAPASVSAPSPWQEALERARLEKQQRQEETTRAAAEAAQQQETAKDAQEEAEEKTTSTEKEEEEEEEDQKNPSGDAGGFRILDPAAVLEALEALNSITDPTNVLLFSYPSTTGGRKRPNMKFLELVHRGCSGVTEIEALLQNARNRIFWLLFREKVASSKTDFHLLLRNVLLVWIGPESSSLDRARVNPHRYDLLRWLSPHIHIHHEADGMEEFRENLLTPEQSREMIISSPSSSSSSAAGGGVGGGNPSSPSSSSSSSEASGEIGTGGGDDGDGEIPHLSSEGTKAELVLTAEAAREIQECLFRLSNSVLTETDHLPLSWVCLGFPAAPNRLQVVATGQVQEARATDGGEGGGVEDGMGSDFAAALDYLRSPAAEDQILFLFLKTLTVETGYGGAPKHAFLHWVGPRVSVLAKARASLQKIQVLEFARPFIHVAAEVYVESKDELTMSRIQGKLTGSGGWVETGDGRMVESWSAGRESRVVPSAGISGRSAVWQAFAGSGKTRNLRVLESREVSTALRELLLPVPRRKVDWLLFSYLSAQSAKEKFPDTAVSGEDGDASAAADGDNDDGEDDGEAFTNTETRHQKADRTIVLLETGQGGFEEWKAFLRPEEIQFVVCRMSSDGEAQPPRPRPQTAGGGGGGGEDDDDDGHDHDGDEGRDGELEKKKKTETTAAQKDDAPAQEDEDEEDEEEGRSSLSAAAAKFEAMTAASENSAFAAAAPKRRHRRRKDGRDTRPPVFREGAGSVLDVGKNLIVTWIGPELGTRHTGKISSHRMQFQIFVQKSVNMAGETCISSTEGVSDVILYRSILGTGGATENAATFVPAVVRSAAERARAAEEGMGEDQGQQETEDKFEVSGFHIRRLAESSLHKMDDTTAFLGVSELQGSVQLFGRKHIREALERLHRGEVEYVKLGFEPKRLNHIRVEYPDLGGGGAVRKDIWSEEWRTAELRTDRVCVYVWPLVSEEVSMNTPKYLYIHWTGQDIPAMLRSQTGDMNTALYSFVSRNLPLSGNMQAVTPAEVTWDKCLEKLTGSKLRARRGMSGNYDTLLGDSVRGKKLREKSRRGEDTKLRITESAPGQPGWEEGLRLLVEPDLHAQIGPMHVIEAEAARLGIQSRLNWILLEYLPEEIDQVRIQKSGNAPEDPTPGIRECLREDAIAFVLARLQHFLPDPRDPKHSQVLRHVYGMLHWTGPRISVLERGLSSAHFKQLFLQVKRDLTRLGVRLQPGHIVLDRDPEELSLEAWKDALHVGEEEDEEHDEE